MKFYNIKDDYIRYLRQYDFKVADNKNESRPYVGIVLEINDTKYYAPLFFSQIQTSKNEKQHRL